ncbi:MAG: electron transport complex subunit E [Gammaproteobacteria bacterium]
MKSVIGEGLWKNNPGLVQLLGLCPLLAISTTFFNALGLGLATIFVLTGSNLAVSLMRRFIPADIRVPIFVVIIASLVTIVELLMNAFFHDLYRVLGIFIPLIVTNCIIIGRAESFASKNSVPMALADGLFMGIGFAFVLVTLGSIREILGKGTLFSQAHMMLGESARDMQIHVLGSDYPGFLFAMLPPGAFLCLGLLIALKNVFDRQQAERSRVKVQAAVESIT